MTPAPLLKADELQQLHERLNLRFWGASGLRSAEALEAALARPLATFDGQPLYAGLLEQLAALVESLVKNHPFVEGNMRTAYVALRLLLLEGGLDLHATEEERHLLMLDIATSKLGYEEIVQWLCQHCAKSRI